MDTYAPQQNFKWVSPKSKRYTDSRNSNCVTSPTSCLRSYEQKQKLENKKASMDIEMLL